MRVLVAEDDSGLCDVLARGLREHDYVVDAVRDGEDAIKSLRSYSSELVLLAWRMPGMSGLDVVRWMRRHNQPAPVLMLTARDALGDIVKGLDAGADDYLTKPFSFVELLARMRALVRRQQFRRKNVLEADDLVLDLTSRRSFRAGKEIYLSLTEFRLVEILARNAGRIVSRHEILANVWGQGREVSENTLDAFVRLLRKKIDDGTEHKLIHTHRGFGYSLGCVTRA